MAQSPYMTKKQVVILLVFSIVGVLVLGSAFTYLLLTQQQGQPSAAPGLPTVSGSISELASSSLPGDGVYLLDGSKAIQIPRIQKNQPIDIQLVIETKDKQPAIAIQGNELPIGQLVLRGFRAGFGIDADFSNLGATVKTVFEGSPAQQAGIQPGDLIVKVDGEPPYPPTVFMPDHEDIFGLMEPSIEIEMVRGTSSSSLAVPRTYLHPSGPFEETLLHSNEKLTITPKDSYIVLTPNKPLKPGVYRLEVLSSNISAGGSLIVRETATPTPEPPESTRYYWVFRVSR